MFQAELDLSQCVAVVLSMLLFQAVLDMPHCAAVAEYVAVSGGPGHASLCCCC